MLFNSYEFLILFLPIVTLFFYILKKSTNVRFILFFLIVSSLFFYSYSKIEFLILITSSIILNFYTGKLILKTNYKKLFLILGIIFNLSILFYFKYIIFFSEIISLVFNFHFNLSDIILPLGISFFTFQQIAFLVDVYHERTKEENIIYYSIFVCFFPQLIAGPIIQHNQIRDQLYNIKNNEINIWKNLANGMILITIGLFKKVLIADKLAIWSDKMFYVAYSGEVVTFIEAWLGVLCFTFQIYFDFSAYSDIAIGLGLLFGLKLPVNFLSPYKSKSIIEFWRTWHITLSNFFRNYVYIPLGGNNSGYIRQAKNLIIVMFLAGLWHGAGWTFIIWGLFHGILLLMNHLYRNFKYILKVNEKKLIYFYQFLTFVLVSLGWVFFRSPDIETAFSVYKGIFGINGLSLPSHYQFLFGNFVTDFTDIGITFTTLKSYGGGYQVLWVFLMLLFVWFLPNSDQISTSLNSNRIEIKESNIFFNILMKTQFIKTNIDYLLAIIISTILIVITIKIIEGKQGEFIYFQF